MNEVNDGDSVFVRCVSVFLCVCAQRTVNQTSLKWELNANSSKTVKATNFKFDTLVPRQWRRSVLRIGGTEERGPKPEARRAEVGVGFLGREQLAPSPPLPPPHQLGGLGERCKLPQWGPRGKAPAAVDFGAF